MDGYVDKTILTIDLGTSGPKTGLYTMRGELIDFEFEAVRLILTPEGGTEQDPAEWWEAICTAARRLAARNRLDFRRIGVISCTGQWTGTVPVDRDGNALMNAIIWMDTRGAPYAKEIVKGPLSFDGYSIPKLMRWLRLTGAAPSRTGKDSLAHILYLKARLPKVYERTYKFLEPTDYLNLHLTGRFAAANDSITMHWVTDNRNPAAVSYDNRLISFATLDREKLPDLKGSLDFLGPITADAARDLELPAGAQVVMGAPDFHAAAIGSSAVKNFTAHLYLGTSSWIGCLTPKRVTSVVHQLGSIPSAIPGRFILGGEQEMAGACLKFLRDTLFFSHDELSNSSAPQDVFAAFDRVAAGSPPGSRGVIFTPWLVGERTPIDDPTVRGALTNLRLTTTRADIVRAVLEGVAFNSRWLLYHFERLCGKRMESLYVVGGGAASDIWCQIYADILDRPLLRLEHPIMATSTGAAYLAALACGTLTVDEIQAQAKITKRFVPNEANRVSYDRLYQEFTRFYVANKKSYARINRPENGSRSSVKSGRGKATDDAVSGVAPRRGGTT